MLQSLLKTAAAWSGAADSATWRGLCAHCMYRSTIPARELQIIQKKQWPPNSPNMNPCRYHVWEAMHKAFLTASSEAKYSFWIKSRTGEWRKHGKIFCRTKLSRVLERCWENTWRLEEDILSVCCYSKKLFILTVFALVLNAISVRQFLIMPERQNATI